MSAIRVIIMPAYEWVRHRSTDSFALGVLYLTLIQAVIGFGIVTAAHAQSQDVLNERLLNQNDNQERRIVNIEELKIERRLVTLEQNVVEMAYVRNLLYGVFATLIGVLFTLIIQIRGQRKGRRDP